MRMEHYDRGSSALRISALGSFHPLQGLAKTLLRWSVTRSSWLLFPIRNQTVSIAAAKAIPPVSVGCQTKRDAMIGLGSNDNFLSSTPHTVTLRTREGWAFLTSSRGEFGLQWNVTTRDAPVVKYQASWPVVPDSAAPAGSKLKL